MKHRAAEMGPWLLVFCAFLSSVAPASAALNIGGDPLVDPADFRITVFAGGLDFPLTMLELEDGALLMGLSHPDGTPGGNWFDSDSELVRFEDADADGVADGPGTVLYTGLAGLVTGLRIVGDLAVVATAEGSRSRVTVLRRGTGPADPYSALGYVELSFPSGWSHTVLEIEARPAPGLPDHLEVLVSVGAEGSEVASVRTVGLSGLGSGSLVADSIHAFTFDDSGSPLTLASTVQVASGVRNPFGMAFSADGSELFFEDNGYGIDGVSLMSDELNRLDSADIGGPVEDFGFPASYVDYVTGAVVGGAGVLPWVAFRPLGGGEESRGPAKIVFAPPLFPPELRHGMFVGFHGGFSAAPASNDTNPLIWVDLDNGDTFHFVAADDDSVGHLNGVLSTRDSLFVADFSTVGGFSGFGAGTVYQIQALPLEVPALDPLGLGVVGVALLLSATAILRIARV